MKLNIIFFIKGTIDILFYVLILFEYGVTVDIPNMKRATKFEKPFIKMSFNMYEICKFSSNLKETENYRKYVNSTIIF